MSAIYHWLVASGLGIFGLTILLFTLVLIGHAYEALFYEVEFLRKLLRETRARAD